MEKHKEEDRDTLYVDVESKGKKRAFKFRIWISTSLANIVKKTFSKKALPWIIAATVGGAGGVGIFQHYKAEPERCPVMQKLERSEGIKLLDNITITYEGKKSGLYLFRIKRGEHEEMIAVKEGEEGKLISEHLLICVKLCHAENSHVAVEVKVFPLDGKLHGERQLKEFTIR